MAYNFKNLADVELLSAMPETANVLVEVDGATKRAPKEAKVDVSAELVAKEALTEVPEGAEVLGVINGEIKRIPGAGLGGSSSEERIPLIVYTISGNDSYLFDKNGNSYDLPTIANAFMNRELFYYSGKENDVPSPIVGFEISTNITFKTGSGKTLLTTVSSAYNESDWLAYISETYGEL